MLQICVLVMLIVVTIGGPGLALITVPVILTWLDHLHRKVNRLRALRETFLDHERQQARLKALRSL